MCCRALFREKGRKNAGFFLFLLLLALCGKSQFPKLKYLGIEKGLSNNSVRCIFQDHQGFMWFGTYDGLNRFDGYEFTVFRNKLGDPASLPYNYVNVINEDQGYNLWIGTGQGIGIFNSLSARWQGAFYQPYGRKVIERITDNIHAIEIDTAGTVFVGTANIGLLVREKGKDVASQIPCKIDGQNRTGYSVQAIKGDGKGRMWIFVEGLGLCRYDDSSKDLRLINATLRSVQCLEGDDGRLWLGTKNGLFVYDITANKITPFQIKNAGKRSAANITSLLLDKQHNLWIGAESSGMNIVNTITGDVVFILPGDEKNNMTSGSVNAVYEDRESRKWIGTLKGGINIVDPEEPKFQTIAHQQRNPNSLINDFVYSFYEDKNQNLWVGTDGGGLSIWNRKQNSFTNFRHNEQDPRSLSHNSVTGILQDNQNDTWIATYGGGINRFGPASGTFEHFSCINGRTGEENKIVLVLFEDKDKDLWAGTFTNGKLYRFNRSVNRFEVFEDAYNDFLTIAEDRKGHLWAGNTGQLIRIDKTHKRHLVYGISKPVRAVYEDRKGNFWVGTEGGGLILFDRLKEQIIRRFSVEDGLCNNSILKILEDDKGQLWLSTFNGLSKFNPNEGTFKNYYQSDGLQSNQFLFRSGLRLQSGEFVFGGIRGFNLFYPDSIQPRSFMPPVVVTNLHINNKPVSDTDAYVVKTSGDKISDLRIPFSDAVLSVDFAALEFSSPDRIVYAYFLEGWDKGWNYSRQVRTANYSNLREGTYFLRIKATNAEGTWNSEERIIKITVLPPWFRTVWAYLFYLSLIATLVYLFLRYKTRQTRLEYEVRLAHLQAEKEKELNEKKLSFFTDVSHEFRTPLTLIINPLKDFLDVKEKEETRHLQVVYRNARRLLSLVDQLLLFQKADTEREELHITKLDFTALCREVFSNFEQGAKSKNLDYRFEAGSENLAIYADKEKMEMVLYNLLSNALKFTPDGGSIRFRLIGHPDEVEVQIADSGPGIPPEAGDRLFERFYRVREGQAAFRPGFGIGLYLVKHFVEKHKGTIHLQSKAGTGTTFTICLKKGTQHLAEETILDEAPHITARTERVEEEMAPVKGRKELEDVISSKSTILIVEDEEEIRTYVAAIFKETFTVYEAGSGEKGLELARELLPDIIISDVMMQNGTGIELCQAVKGDPSLGHIPVILLTAVSSSEIKLKGVEGGADDYITKPFEKDLLVARVNNLLKSRNALQQYFYNEVTLRQNNGKISPEYKEFLEQCIAIVEAHLEDDDFTIKKLTREIGMSHSSLYRKVKAISGQSVSAFIRFLRIRKAAELMLKSNLNVTEAAFQVGFSDVKYFRRQFQKLFGINPSEYIKKYRSSFSGTFSFNQKVMDPDD